MLSFSHFLDQRTYLKYLMQNVIYISLTFEVRIMHCVLLMFCISTGDLPNGHCSMKWVSLKTWANWSQSLMHFGGLGMILMLHGFTWWIQTKMAKWLFTVTILDLVLLALFKVSCISSYSTLRIFFFMSQLMGRLLQQVRFPLQSMEFCTGSITKL